MHSSSIIIMSHFINATFGGVEIHDILIPEPISAFLFYKCRKLLFHADILQHEPTLSRHKKVKLSDILRDLLTLTHSNTAPLLLSSL